MGDVDVDARRLRGLDSFVDGVEDRTGFAPQVGRVHPAVTMHHAKERVDLVRSRKRPGRREQA